jgi:type VI secretion system protein ImpG
VPATIDTPRRRAEDRVTPDATEDDLFWLARRRDSAWRSDEGTDVMMSFVDRSGRPAHPSQEAVTARVTCFNSDLPSRLPFGNPDGDFELDGAGPIREIVAIIKPTRVVQAPLGDAQSWRLISQLSLNYLSLVDRGGEALRETLRVYDFGDSAAVRKQIEGISGVDSAATFARIVTDHGLTFARGRRIELEFDEEQFTGGGVFLFGQVLERFFGLYASMNSFSVLVARSRQRKRVVHEWPPRAGWKPLL